MKAAFFKKVSDYFSSVVSVFSVVNFFNDVQQIWVG